MRTSLQQNKTSNQCKQTTFQTQDAKGGDFPEFDAIPTTTPFSYGTCVAFMLRFRCKCQHHTCGETCNRCCAGFNQRRWRPAALGQHSECEGEWMLRLRMVETPRCPICSSIYTVMRKLNVYTGHSKRRTATNNKRH